MPKKIDMIGKKFGKLTVVSECGKGKRGYRYNCVCDCGGIAEAVSGRDLRTLHKTSCGCNLGNRRRTHGMSFTRPHQIWQNMKRRCNNPNNNAYRNYGGRGITYCKEWEKFENFWRDMEEGYDDNLTLDRIDNNGNYCKENCRWVDYKTQMNNMRSNRIIEYKGKEYTLSELSEATGIKYWLLQLRLSKDMPAKEAVETPLHELEKITFNGETKTVVDFAKEKGMTYYQLKKRLMRGWSTERALTQPLRPPRYPKAAKQRFF